jgi:TonB-linked SusC/RagA family outer membrane protein
MKKTDRWVQSNPNLKKLIMELKIGALLILISVSSLLANSTYSQTAKVSLKMENKSLEQVMDEIERQSEFYFIFNQKQIDVDRKVTINSDNQLITAVLPDLFRGTPINYAILDRKILLTTDPISENLTVLTPAVQRKITGMVTDKAGEPLPGVNVRVTGTAVGATTDFSGKYSLEVPADARSLTFSYVGLVTREMIIGTESVIDVVMEESAIGLDEVVVIAYGTAKRSSLTGSVSTIGSKSLQNIQTSNLTTGLQGLAPGVQVVNTSGQPGAEQTVIIRGLGSMTASSAPLYVVDGIPYTLSLNSIPFNDIESISILKDGAASSLYGAHAANGVVLITTKRGKAGKLKVDFTASYGTSDLAVMFPEKVSINKQWENVWQSLYNDATDFKGMNDTDARKYASDNVSGVFYNPMPFTLPDGTQRLYHSGWDTDYPIGLDGKVKADARRLWDYDSYDEFFRHRLKQDYNLSLSGSFNDKNRYFASFSGLNDKGASLLDGFTRLTGRMGVDSKLADWLDLSNTVLYSDMMNTNRNMDPRRTRALSRENTRYIYDYATGTFKTCPLMPDLLALDNTEETGRRAWGGVALFDEMLNEKYTKTQNLQTTTSLTARFLDGFTFKTTYAFQLSNALSVNNAPPFSGAKLEPDYGYLSKSSLNETTNYFNNLLTYDKTAGDHHINLLAGQEASMYRNMYLYAGRSGVAIPFFKEVSQAINYPDVNSNIDTYNLFSYLARAQYDYKSKYFVNASYRSDGSSRFSKQNRWGNFFSFGAAWKISQEEFLKPAASWLNNLRLRVGYGEVGNDNVAGYYGYQGYFSPGGAYYGFLGMVNSQLPNPDLKWETNIQTNAGLEFELFNRLRGNFEFFERKSKDLLLETPLPTSTGRESVMRNIGDLKNTGFEAELSYDLIKKEDMILTIFANGTHYKNVITSLPFDSKSFRYGNGYYKWVVGGSRYDIYCSDWAGINPDNGRNTWWKYTFDEEGNIIDKVKTENFSEVNNEQQRVKVGSGLPTLFGSFGTTFQYKGFDLSAMIYYSLGGYVYDYLLAESSVLRESWSTYALLDQAWKKPGDITDYPKVYQYYSNAAYSRQNIGSSQFITRNDFLRLKNLTVGYTLPQKLIAKAHIAGLRVFFRGDNLFTTGKMAKNGSDPESGSIGGTTMSGYSYFITRNLNLGATVTF